MTKKATITIENTPRGVILECTHDETPTGPRETWSMVAIIADDMVRSVLSKAEKLKVGHTVHTTDTVTGHTSIRSTE
jgi:hypothetical protein